MIRLLQFFPVAPTLCQIRKQTPHASGLCSLHGSRSSSTVATITLVAVVVTVTIKTKANCTWFWTDLNSTLMQKLLWSEYVSLFLGPRGSHGIPLSVHWFFRKKNLITYIWAGMPSKSSESLICRPSKSLKDPSNLPVDLLGSCRPTLWPHGTL